MRKKYALILSLLLTGLIFSTFYLFSANQASKRENKESVLVTRVIDGDTFVSSNNRTNRLLNINTFEKGERGYEEAKTFVKNYENKTLEIEILGRDKYNRNLVRVYAPDYLNLRIVQEGLASKFLVDKSELRAFAEAEEKAIKEQRGNWRKSPYFGCLSASINKKGEIVYITNKCQNISFDGWFLKDESRKKYTFHLKNASYLEIHSGKGINTSNILHWGQAQSIWNDDRDTLYIFDSQGRIVYHESYGY